MGLYLVAAYPLVCLKPDKHRYVGWGSGKGSFTPKSFWPLPTLRNNLVLKKMIMILTIYIMMMITRVWYESDYPWVCAGWYYHHDCLHHNQVSNHHAQLLTIIMIMIINIHKSHYDDHEESMILQSRTINRRALAGIRAGSVIPNPSHDDDGENSESIQNENAYKKCNFQMHIRLLERPFLLPPHW